MPPPLAPAASRIEAALAAQRGPTRRRGHELFFRCFYPEKHQHGDAHPSARWNADKLLWVCDVCHDGGGWVNLARRLGLEVGEDSGPSPGVTLETLAHARGLDPAFLRSLGWRDAPDPWYGRPAIAIPYRDTEGREVRTRWRLALEKPRSGPDSRFAWGPGDSILPYGLDRLQEAQAKGFLTLLEGESDCATLWQHGFPALGLPGKGTWRSDLAQYLGGIGRISLWQEPGAEDLPRRVAKDVPGLLVVKAPPEAKDPAKLAKLLGQSFPARFRELLEAAQAPNLTSHDSPLMIRSEVVGLPRVNAAALQVEAQRPDRPRLQFLPLLEREGFFVKGFSHLLSGYPKTGKTELLARLALSWSRQGLAVCYFTEEPRLAWEERLAKLPQGWEAVSLVFALGSTPEVIHSTIAGGEETVVILDTLRLLGLEDENDNSLINRALTPLIALCRDKVKTLVLAHHTRKMGGEFGMAAAGGHALVGIVDIMLELLRDGQATRRRRIRGWGRIVEVPELLYELRDGELVALGDPEEVALEEVKARLRDILNGDFQKTDDLRKALGDPAPSKAQVGKALAEMASAGEVERDPPIADGTRQGKAYRWRNFTSHYIGKAIRSEVGAAPWDEV